MPEPYAAPSMHSVVLANRYEIAGVLGVGGMGSVYRARDRELDELVALKVLRRELVAQPGMVERFRREVKLARRVTHRNVARVFDIGAHEGEKFITMELVDGEPLASRLRREGALPPGDVIAIAGEIAEGLAAAHAAGVVHRDLKPDNVLIAQDGRVVISDFGIARALSYPGQGGRTAGLVVGTPEYMAPEQIESGASIDGRADLYALGVMLFEMLTGKPPWQGDSPLAIATARLLRAPPDAREANPAVPNALADLVRRMMARAPSERPARVEEVASLLAKVTPPAGRSPSMRPPRARHGARAPQRIAIVPLTTEHAPDEWLGFGVAELIADALDGRPGVDIRARGSRFATGEGRDLRALGEDLDVPLVVGGTITERDGRTVALLRLVNARDGFVLWTQSFDDPRAAPFAVALSAADAIARALLVPQDEPAAPALADPVAAEMYLRARHAAVEATADGHDRAIALFERAIERAPQDPWVNASYAVALAHRLVETEFSGDAEEALAMATFAAQRAPRMALAHLATAEVLVDRGSLEQAARALVTARALAPAHPAVERAAGHLLIAAGELAPALAALWSASSRELPPWRAAWDEARALASLGRWAEADERLDAAADVEPSATAPWLARARYAMWRRDSARCEALRAQLDGALVADRSLVMAVLDAALAAAPLPVALARLDEAARVTASSLQRSMMLRQAAVDLAFARDDRAEATRRFERLVEDGLCDGAWPTRAALGPRPVLDERARRLAAILNEPHQTLYGEAR